MMDEINELIVKGDDILDLGFGLPSNYETAMPLHMLEKFKEVANSAPCSSHQGTHLSGEPSLKRILSTIYSKFCNRDIDQSREVLVTCGASEALYCAITSNVGPGDEVIIMEPAYDTFIGITKLARATPVWIKLKETFENGSSSGWVLDINELRTKFNCKTKMIILNNPHNPTGKTFSMDELMSIADLCKEFDVICLSDEVYEFQKVGAKDHIRIASVEGMWDKTIAVGSVGKCFGLTGWRIGWAYGAEHLIKKATEYHKYVTYNCPTMLQEVIASALEFEFPLIGSEDSYWSKYSKLLRMKQERISGILRSVGMRVLPVDSTYYIMADVSDLQSRIDMESETGRADVKFVKWMISNLGVGAIPGSVFYQSNIAAIPENYLRFCFIKDDKVLDDLEKRLAPLNRIKRRYY